jgi:hypothetical protein
MQLQWLTPYCCLHINQHSRKDRSIACCLRSFIAEKYQGATNSRIWLFGLSRGAYTARCVAGMINNCGILDFRKLPDKAARDAAVNDAYQLYRRQVAVQYRCRCLQAEGFVDLLNTQLLFQRFAMSVVRQHGIITMRLDDCNLGIAIQATG